MNDDRNTPQDKEAPTHPRSQTGEISNDELDKDAVRRTDERVHSQAETGEDPGTASRSDLGAGE